MREIKFRAWDKTHKEMINNIWIAPQYDWTVFSDNDALCERKRLPEGQIILMQYTGLKDANKLEGYAGDISEDLSSGERYKIEFVDGAFCLVDKNGVGHEILDLQHQYIIGNIYENPELLEPGKELSR